MIDNYDGVVSWKDRKLLPDQPGVYILIRNNDEIIYVGQSQNMRIRMQTHNRLRQFKKFRFDNLKIYWVFVPPKNLSQVEKSLIDKFDPELNNIPAPLVQSSIQLPEITRRQLYDIAKVWGITDQDYDTKARWISEVIQIMTAKQYQEIAPKDKT